MTDTGGPAFPLIFDDDTKGTREIYSGMTLRDYFAGIALPRAMSMTATGIREFANGDPLANQPGRWAAAAAYKMADAMLKARNV